MKRILIALLVIFIVIQFFRPTRNQSAPSAARNHISTRIEVPPHIDQILEKACNDCHSNNTRYPWYFAVQPVGWWLDYHIRDGKKGLNFDEFATYRLSRQYHKMEELEEEVTESHMPLYSYTLLHKGSRISDQQKQALVSWSRSARDRMEALYPPDSLKRK